MFGGESHQRRVHLARGRDIDGVERHGREHRLGAGIGLRNPELARAPRGIHEANDAFHVALFSACGNPYLVHSLQDYMNLTLPMRAKNLADREGLALSRRQHELMIELLKGRDSWALAQLCVDHMQFSKSDYLGRIGGDPKAS